MPLAIVGICSKYGIGNGNDKMVPVALGRKVEKSAAMILSVLLSR